MRPGYRASAVRRSIGTSGAEDGQPPHRPLLPCRRAPSRCDARLPCGVRASAPLHWRHRRPQWFFRVEGGRLGCRLSGTRRRFLASGGRARPYRRRGRSLRDAVLRSSDGSASPASGRSAPSRVPSSSFQKKETKPPLWAVARSGNAKRPRRPFLPCCLSACKQQAPLRPVARSERRLVQRHHRCLSGLDRREKAGRLG